MQVHSINIYTNQPNFGNISRQPDTEWNMEQDRIASQITNLMKKPMERYEGKTAEDYYKSIGYDFRILPHKEDSVHLTARKNSKENKKYPYFVDIGKYTNEKTFDIKDLDTMITPESFKDNAAGCGFLMLSLALFTGIIVTFTNKIIKAQKSTKPLIENVSTSINKIDISDSDSIKQPIKLLKIPRK